MNFCRPDSDEDDKPEDWLISSLFFVGALGHLLQDKEGVVVKAKNDLARMVGNEGSYIIHRQDGKIVVSSTEEDIAEGTMVWMEETPPEETK